MGRITGRAVSHRAVVQLQMSAAVAGLLDGYQLVNLRPDRGSLVQSTPNWVGGR